ncbi:MAG TPA: SAM-dependent methyltransferase [Streptosporangiaceae bacterium]|jgi:hypothetical protein
MRDWVAWHEEYDDPSSGLSARLMLVQQELARALDRAPAGPVQLVSLCAGQGRDVIGTLPAHPRRDDVSALLIEADPALAGQARAAATAAGLSRVEVREGDASQVSTFADAPPAGVLLLCGIFGNVSPDDIRRTVAAAPALCTPGATVLWTRHRGTPDLTPRIRDWFTAAGFEEVAFGSPPSAPRIGVGAAVRRAGVGGGWPEEPLFRFGSAHPFRTGDHA